MLSGSASRVKRFPTPLGSSFFSACFYTTLGSTMVRGNKKVLALGVALLGLAAVRQLSFVPGPLRKAAPAAASASLMMAPAAFADEIGDAAKKLGDASYDFAKEVDWNTGIFLQAPGKFEPLKALTAIDKMIVAWP